MKLLFCAIILLILPSCRDAEQVALSTLERPQAKLAFGDYVNKSIKKKSATIILDEIIEPKGIREVVPSEKGVSLGFYVDDQFKLSDALRFVTLYSSDGGECGSAQQGEMFPSGGLASVDFKIVNEGELPRRVLVYSTNTAEQAVPGQPEEH